MVFQHFQYIIKAFMKVMPGKTEINYIFKGIRSYDRTIWINYFLGV